MTEKDTNGIGFQTEYVDSLTKTKRLVRRCAACESTDIEIDDHLLVCTKCGQIFHTNQFRNDPTQEYTENCRDFEPTMTMNLSSNNRFTFMTTRLPVAKKMGLNCVEQLSSVFAMRADMKEMSITKYKELCSHQAFNCCSTQTKRILAAISVYTTLISENRPVTIGHLCNAISVSNSDFGKVFTQVIKWFPVLKPDAIPIENLVSVTLSEAKFENNEELKQLEIMVKKIIELERECWLIEGRSPFHVIFAAAFIAWKSLKPYDRRRVKLTEFCKKVKIEYKHTTSERVTELINAIKTLASKIPGKQNLKITRNNVSAYISEILEYQNSLVFDLNMSLKRNSNPNEDQNPCNKSIEWINAFKRKSFPQNSQKNTIPDREYRSDEEISDSEINKYLRNPIEVKLIKKLKRISQAVEDEEEEEEESD